MPDSEKSSIPFDHMPSRSGVYVIRNTVTNECYVGAASDLYTRAEQHDTQLRCGTHFSNALSASYCLHGASAFRFEVLALMPEKKLAVSERYWIRKLCPAFNLFTQRTVEGWEGNKSLQCRAFDESRISTHAGKAGVTRLAFVATILNAWESLSPDQKLKFLTSSTFEVEKSVKLYKKNRIPHETPNRIRLGIVREKSVEMVRGGMKAVDVAKELGVYPGLVCRACRNAGIPLKKGRPRGSHVDPSKPSRLSIRWSDTDWTLKDIRIADLYGVSREAVRQARMRLGAPPSPNKWMREIPASSEKA